MNWEGISPFRDSALNLKEHFISKEKTRQYFAWQDISFYGK
jgi:hypothetical protein